MAYADCFAAAAAIERKAMLMTSDPEFQAVKHLVKVARNQALLKAQATKYN